MHILVHTPCRLAPRHRPSTRVYAGLPSDLCANYIRIYVLHDITSVYISHTRKVYSNTYICALYRVDAFTGSTTKTYHVQHILLLCST